MHIPAVLLVFFADHSATQSESPPRHLRRVMFPLDYLHSDVEPAYHIITLN